MIDLHTHTLFSDGVLLPAELIQRARHIGYEAIALTDHADESNYDHIIPRLIKACSVATASAAIRAVPGIEITHVQPANIAPLVRECRKLGAKLIVVHGETLVEPVPPGTNLSAVRAGIDILAHPGLISAEAVQVAAEMHVSLEVTARGGHSLANGHVAKLALAYGAQLVLNTDTHSPDNLITDVMARAVACGAGLSEDRYEEMTRHSRSLVQKVLG